MTPDLAAFAGAPLIDTHVNLHAEAFAADREAVIAAARAAGVVRMLTICDRMENAEAVRAIAAAHPDIAASVGTHPHHAKDHQALDARALIAAADHPEIAAIGETGLDLHYNYSPLEDQVRVFRAHIAAARATGLALIIHTRNADAETAEILEEEYARGAFPMLLHCYTSGMDLARRAWALGGFISFSGILTFKTAEEVRAVAREAPLDRVVLETDCPYLAPAPKRGRRCEPAFVAEVYAYFCALRGLDPAAGAEMIAGTVRRCFPRLMG